MSSSGAGGFGDGGDRRGGGRSQLGRSRGPRARSPRGRGRGRGHSHPPPEDRRNDDGRLRVREGGHERGSGGGRPFRGGEHDRGSGRGRPFRGGEHERGSSGGRPFRGRGRGDRGRGDSDRRPSEAKRYRREREEDSPRIHREAQIHDIIVHSFFPKQLPDNVQDNLVIVEEKMLDLVRASISEAINSIDDGSFQQLKTSEAMLQLWKDIQPKFNSDVDEAKFMNCIKEKLLSITGKDQRTIPIYIRNQNCTLLIKKEGEGALYQLSTFRPSLPSEVVMSTVGSLTVSYPETSDRVYNSQLLTSDLFLRHIHQLSVDQFELSLPTTRKGEDFYTDYRDVPEPFLVSDWIIGSLAPAKCTDNSEDSDSDINPMYFSLVDYTFVSVNDCHLITKKIRDQVVCQMSSRAVPFRRSGMWTSIKVALQLQLRDEFGYSKGQLIYKLIMLRVLSSICQQYCKESPNMVDLDLLSQMTAKLGRRAFKIINNFDQQSSESEMIIGDDDDDQDMAPVPAPDTANKITLLKESTFEFCKSVVESAQQQMNGLWRKAASYHPIIHPITRAKKDFLSDLTHETEWLDDHIQPHITDVTLKMKHIQLENLQKVDALKSSPDFLRSLKFHRYPCLEDILKSQKSFNSKYSELDEVNERIWLYDTESYVKSGKLEEYLCLIDAEPSLSDQDKEKNLKSLQEFITAYFKNSVGHYTLLRDPAAFSQMLLVVLKLLQILDKVTTAKHSLLLEYSLDVNPTLFERLILPHSDDILMLDELVDYFAARNDKAVYPSMIEDNRPEPESFQVRFAKNNEEMVRCRQKILANTEMAIKMKLKDVRKVRKECEHLQMDLTALGGSCKMRGDDGDIHDNQLATRNYNSMTCRRCRIHRELDIKRRSVPTYERPLPPETQEYLQWAVIFEFKIPPEIALLRDMLALLNWEMLGEPIFKGKQASRLKLNLGEMADDPSKSLPVEEWSDYLKRRCPGPEFKPTGGSSLNSLNLISPTIATSGTCNTKIMLLDVMTNPDDKFVMDNGLDCVYYHDKPLWFPIIKKPRQLCVYQLASTNKPDADIYESLQWTVDSTNHTQNAVIAKKFHLCHKSLPLEEFVGFGSLRADGHRIQLRNLYRLMYDCGLSFHKEPVLALILQTIWQVGAKDSHIDFSQNSLEFSMQFLEMLEEFITSLENNYSEPLALLTVVMLTTRILELNADCECQEGCRDLLRKCRNLVSSWSGKIQQRILVLSESDDEVGLKYLKERLLEASLCSIFSFYVSNENLIPMVLESKEDHVQWFHAISNFHQLTVEEQVHKGMSDFIQLLINSARKVPLKLKLEDKLDFAFLKEPLHVFTCEKWSKAIDIPLEKTVWNSYDKNKHILVGAYEEPAEDELVKAKPRHFISLDLIRGAFLVNGFTQSTLPLCILEHSLFRRFFRDSKFRIQRYSKCARTIDKFHGRHYDFEMVVKSKKRKDSGDGGSFEMSQLIIREIGERGTALELMEPVLFRKIVGSPFVENYTHWLNHRAKVVQFRRIPKEDKDYELLHDYSLYKDPSDKQWKFYDERQRKHLLSINSEGFRQVTAALSRLECSTEISVLFNGDADEDEDMDKDKSFITARLPRFRLNFNLIQGFLNSVEYSDFRIATNQNMGTLIGLQQGLLLEQSSSPDRYSKRILIVPHGYLESMLLHLKCHPSTMINLDKLRHPKFFVYEYDTVLKTLKGDKSEAAWLYLAALHARTSSSLPDPFTKLTGTESAVGILESGRVWPTVPYDEESLISLDMIRNLAPLRSYYGHGLSLVERKDNKERKGSEKMEITQWSDVIPSMASFDGFPLIVDKLMENSKRLSKLYPQLQDNLSATMKMMEKRRGADTSTMESEQLQLRAYLRYLPLYNQAAFVGNEFIKRTTLDKRATCGAGAHWKLGQMKLRDKSSTRMCEGFGLRELLRIGQTRLVNSVENKSLSVWEAQVEKSGLVQYFKTDDGVTVPPAYFKAHPSSLEGLHLKDLLHFDFKPNWLQLYSWATSKQIGSSHQFTLVLSAVAYHGNVPLEQVMHLHHLSYLTSAHSVDFPPIPKFSGFSKAKTKEQREGQNGDDLMEDFPEMIIPTQCNYVVEEIQTVLEGNILPISSSVKFESLEEASEATQKHLELALEECSRIAVQLGALWPCENIVANSEEVKKLFGQASIASNKSVEEINQRLQFWFRNRQFNLFIQEIQDKMNEGLRSLLGEPSKFQEELNKYTEYEFSSFPEVQCDVQIVADGKVLPIDLEELMEDFPEGRLEEASQIFETGKIPQVKQNGEDFMEEDEDLKDLLIQQRQHCEEKIELLLEDITKTVTRNSNLCEADWGAVKEILNYAGITPRLTGGKLLEYILPLPFDDEVHETDLFTYMGAIGVLWTHLKRLNRCIALEKRGIAAISELRKELDNPGHENWSPAENPEWLLLELDLDIMIRKIQVNVARQMISMPDGGNGVLQLNMGEGKTSVIVPMLCSSLGGKEALARVTVLKSIYKMNLGILKFAIGGLLNQRVYTLPCRRDLGIDLSSAETLKELLDEARIMKGVMLTLPEYRLSFRLLAYDMILKGEHALGVTLLQIENWLRRYCRDILDECDELLSFKYQLVYTTGNQISIDGDELRWKTCQSVLDSVRSISGKMLEEHGLTKVEYNWAEAVSNPEQFKMTRLLCEEEEFLEDFRTLVANEQLTSLRGLEDHQRRLLRGFIVDEEISEETYEHVMEYLQDKPELLIKVLLLSAYLKRGVLSLALRKRWRVEYGVDPSGPRAMAVPFRAKDCAAERTEFGHPDLAIVLTHLSYYYSGLDDDSLLKVFEILRGLRDGETIYDRWISQIPAEKLDDSLRQLRNLNLRSDTEQKESLFRLLRRHKAVVDFWLSHEVFPRESKQFPSKLTMTAWDLVWERQHHPVIGFSGTNGSKDLLPLPITQQDLDELEDTNKRMEEALEGPENDGQHKGFEMGVSCREVLESMRSDSMKILIDAGALMLECNNEQVAQLWLEVDPQVEAAIYFSKGDELLVKERQEEGNERRNRDVEDVPLELSPYRTNLDKCAVFLDEQHTRGTDLKFPVGAKACVTVGTRMLRDKLMQACMRMRKLGNGHSVAFYLSHEAYEKVRADENLLEVKTADVINWTKVNTEAFNQDGLLYWAICGRNYAQKLAAEDLFHFPNGNGQHSGTWEGSGGVRSESSLNTLAKQCEDDDVTRLMDMYGSYGRKELLLELVQKWFESVKSKLKRIRLEHGEGSEWPEEILHEFERVEDGVLDRCGELYTGKMIFSSMMEEEQEKELEKEKEVEIEEEREMERPLQPEDAKPALHSNVRAVSLEGVDIKKMSGILGLSEIFCKTTFWDEAEKLGCWGEVEVYATKDFSTVISSRGEGIHSMTDSYLRPVEYLLTSGASGSPLKTKLLVLSPFEVNKMLPVLRKGDGKKVKLHMFSRRRSQSQDILLNNMRLRIPSPSTSSYSQIGAVELGSDSLELAALLISSGNLYFGNDSEKEAFGRFLNLKEDDMNISEEEEYNDHDEDEDEDMKSVDEDDTILSGGCRVGVTLKKILACRHPVVSDASDVVQFLDENCL